MNRWITFFKTRCHPILFLLLVIGLSLSGILLQRGELEFISFFISVIGISLYLFCKVVIEELKSYRRDSEIFPDAPFLEGAFTVTEFQTLYRFLQVGMLFFTFLLWIFFSYVSAALFLLIALYISHLEQDFHIRKWLTRRPFFFGFTKEVIVMVVALFPYSLVKGEEFLSTHSLTYSSMILGAFLTFEYCKNLDPMAEPKCQTYVQYYGFKKVFYLSAATLLLSALGAKGSGLAFFVWPVEIAVFLALCLVFLNAAYYRLAEGTVILSLIIHAWALPFSSLF